MLSFYTDVVMSKICISIPYVLYLMQQSLDTQNIREKTREESNCIIKIYCHANFWKTLQGSHNKAMRHMVLTA